MNKAAAQTLQERQDLLVPSVTIEKPDGDGPFPVAILMHGCGGRREMMDNYARAIAAAGGAAIVIDSLTPRDIGRIEAVTQVCTALRLRGYERAGDLYAMTAWARAQDWVDPERIIAAGWSHGGWTVMDALAMKDSEEMAEKTGLTDLPAEPLTGLAGAVLFYPYVGPLSSGGRRAWRLSPPTLAIIGGRDNIVGSTGPTRALERHRERGVPMRVELFEDATHAFDEVSARDLRIEYNAQLTAKAEQMLAQFVVETAAQ